MPPALFLGALLVQALTHMLAPVFQLVPRPWNLLGVLPIGVGLSVLVAADRQFKRAQTPVHPFERPAALVTNGVFAVSRNPMYVGMVAVLLGVAVVLGTLTPVLVPPLFGWVIAARFVRAEEAALTERFGDTYTAYARRVRRWL